MQFITYYIAYEEYFLGNKKRLGPQFSNYIAYIVFCLSDATLDGTIELSGVDLVGVGAVSIFLKNQFFHHIS